MSPLFIKHFKDRTHCPSCKASPQEGYVCCPKHLEAAKIRFRLWTSERKAKHLCCYCDHKSFNGWIRCKTHTIKNRIKIKLWCQKHPEHYKQSWEKQKAIRDAGLCPTCPQHRPLSNSYKRCLTCRQRARLYDLNVKTDKNTPPEVVQALFDRHSTKMMKARRKSSRTATIKKMVP